MYREEYAKAGFKMLPVIDPEGHRTGRQAVSHTLGLLPVSLCPFLFQADRADLSGGRVGAGHCVFFGSRSSLRGS